MVAAFKSLKGERVTARDGDGHEERAIVLAVTFTPTGDPRIRVKTENGHIRLCTVQNVRVAQ